MSSALIPFIGLLPTGWATVISEYCFTADIWWCYRLVNQSISWFTPRPSGCTIVIQFFTKTLLLCWLTGMPGATRRQKPTALYRLFGYYVTRKYRSLIFF